MEYPFPGITSGISSAVPTTGTAAPVLQEAPARREVDLAARGHLAAVVSAGVPAAVLAGVQAVPAAVSAAAEAVPAAVSEAGVNSNILKTESMSTHAFRFLFV